MVASVFELEFRQSPVAQAYLDDGGRIVTVNDAFARLAGRSANALEGESLEGVLQGHQALLKRHPIRDVHGRTISERVEVAADAGEPSPWFTSGPVQLWHTDAAGTPLPLPFMKETGQAVTSVHWEDAAKYQDAFRAAREAGIPFSITVRFLRPNGGYSWMRSEATPVRNASGLIERWIGFTVSVDDLMLELRGQHSALKEARDRLAELDGFVSMLAHEVSAPARGISLVAQFLMEDAKHVDLGFTGKSLDLLEQRSRQLTRIVDNLLSFARLESPRDIERVKPEVIIEEVLKLLAPGRRTRVDVVRPMPEFDYSASAFQQVMTNLIGNALQVGAKNVMVRGEREADFVHFEVDDDGPGIPPDQQDKVFDLFHTTALAEGNLGVGLAMVRKIAERSGGSVKLDSVPGRGTVFHVRLPYRS